MDNNDEHNRASSLDDLTKRLSDVASKHSESDKKMMLKNIRSDIELLRLNIDQLRILEDIYETLNHTSLKDLEDQRESLRNTQLELGIFKGIAVGVNKLVDLAKKSTSKKTRNILGNILVNLIAIPAAVTAAVLQVGKELGKILKDTFKGKGVLGKIFNVFFKFPAMQIGKIINSFIQSVPVLRKAADAATTFANTTFVLFNTLKGVMGRLFGNAKDLTGIILDFVKSSFNKSGQGFFAETKSIVAKIAEGISDLYLALLNSVRSFGGFAEKASKASNIVTKVVEKLLQILKAIQKISVNVGKLFGKIFVPIKFILSVWSFVTGALEEAAKQSSLLPKIIGGLLGGIGSLFGFIVGGTLDLFKSLTGFILGFFGKPGKVAKEFVNSFSFEKIIKDMFGFLIDLVMLFVPGGKSDLAENLSEATKKLKESLITKITGAFNTFIKDPIMSIFERIGAFFAGVKAFIGSIADQGITGLIKNGIGEVLDNANAEFEKARSGSLSGSADQKESVSDKILDKGSKLAKAAKDTATNVVNNIVNNGGDTNVQNTSMSSVRSQARKRRGFNNDSGLAYR